MSTLPQFLQSGSGVALTSADLDSLKRRDRPRVLVARGSRMRTKAALLNEVSAVLQFPLDFGDNWDALADSLGDLDQLGGQALVVLGVAQAEQVLADEAGAFGTFVAVLADRGVQVLLAVSDDADGPAVRSAWAAAGLTVEALA
ncbi:barstar family protein [Tsukamurella spumae]|uniref:Barstar family protein n=1 Tax=Tsukamurella spumae TaxID=44753 RepID=A0A846X790_9ACTN|nr:barstar family protein [Tsukamurella spumae]NKY20159.1 barstar family protein [Tsukamurella spumae]